MTSIKDLGAILEENGAEICVEAPPASYRRHLWRYEKVGE